MEHQNTRVERINSQIKSNPIVAALIILGTIVIALSTFTDAAARLFSLVSKQSPAAARAELGQMSLNYSPEAFVLSAETGDLTAVRLFLTAGMDPNATDNEGATALSTAAYKGHVQIVAALIKAGADVKIREGHNSALFSAASGGRIDCLRILLEKNPDAETINDAFIAAVKTRHHEVGRLLVDKGAEVKRIGSIAMMTLLVSGGWRDHEMRA